MSYLQEWLNEEPNPETDLEFNEDGSEYIPIWIVEMFLDRLTMSKWSRGDHKYTFQPIGGRIFLATSHTIQLHPDEGWPRTIICSSFIDIAAYPDNTNILQTGIAEATKAGVKVLGAKFGKNLNNRNILKPKPNGITRQAVKTRPDVETRRKYAKAAAEQDHQTIDFLESLYDFQIG